MGNFQGLFIQFSLALQVSYGLYCPSVCQCTREESMTHTVVDIDCRALNWTRSELPKAAAAKSQAQQQGVSVNLNASYSHVSDDIVTLTLLSPFSSITTLTLCCSNITRVSPDSFMFSGDTTAIDFSWNLLTDISFIWNLTKLESVIMKHNNIQSIAIITVRDLTALKKLDLSENQLTSVDFLIGTLPSVVELNINNNLVKWLNPHSFYNKPDLTDVDLSNNLITAIGFCHIFPLLQEPLSLQSFNMHGNILTCECYLTWLNYLPSVSIGHAECAQPGEWKTTQDVIQFCKAKDIKLPNCTDLKGVSFSVDPYGFAKPIESGGAKFEDSHEQHSKNRGISHAQIAMLIGVGCLAMAVLAAAIMKKRRTERSQLKRSNTSLKAPEQDLLEGSAGLEMVANEKAGSTSIFSNGARSI